MASSDSDASSETNDMNVDEASPPSPGSDFGAGSRVFLQGLKKQAHLNGKAADVLEWDAGRKRFAVRCTTGEKLSVRATNLTSQTPTATTALVDRTLFLVGGEKFIQPNLHHTTPPQPDLSGTTPTQDPAGLHGGTTVEGDYRVDLPVPAGLWAVRLVEQDDEEITVTLHAEPWEGVEGNPLSEQHATWNELAGMCCTRTAPLPSGGAFGDCDACLADGVLTLTAPRLHLATPADEPQPTGHPASQPTSQPASLPGDDPRAAHGESEEHAMEVDQEGCGPCYPTYAEAAEAESPVAAEAKLEWAPEATDSPAVETAVLDESLANKENALGVEVAQLLAHCPQRGTTDDIKVAGKAREVRVASGDMIKQNESSQQFTSPPLRRARSEPLPGEPPKIRRRHRAARRRTALRAA